MTWEIDQEVVKVACPDGCPCDGHEIPPGTVGYIEGVSARVPLQVGDEKEAKEAYLLVYWPNGRRWWVYEHGLVTPFALPDLFYLDP